jgi:hypothetical protein
MPAAPSNRIARLNQLEQRLSGHHVIDLFQKDLPPRLLPLTGVLRIPELIWLTDYLVLFQCDDQTKITTNCSDFP